MSAPRFHPPSVVDLFQRTKLKPAYEQWWEPIQCAADSGPPEPICGACLAGAVYIDRFGADSPYAVLSLGIDRAVVAKQLGWSYDYLSGLIEGWDGFPPNPEKDQERQYGHADGSQALAIYQAHMEAR